MNKALLDALSASDWSKIELGGSGGPSRWRETLPSVRAADVRITAGDQVFFLRPKARSVPGAATPIGDMVIDDTPPSDVTDWKPLAEVPPSLLRAAGRTVDLLTGREAVRNAAGNTSALVEHRVGIVVSVGSQRFGFLLGPQSRHVHCAGWSGPLMPPAELAAAAG
jgi:hypothetical protein